MNGSPVNGPRALADMRDVAALREVVDREAQAGALFRAEVRAFIARTEEELRAARVDRGTMLRHLGRLVDVPADRETLSPLGAWLSRPASTRAVLAGLSAALVLSIVGSVAALPLARSIWPLQTVPPHTHETARAEVPR